MTKANEISLFDPEGNLLWEGEIESPILGLQGGETFWYGTPANRTWAKVISAAYGIDVENNSCMIELVIEPSNQRSTRTLKPKTKLIDHGEYIIKGKGGGSCTINDSDIIVTTGEILLNCVNSMALQINSAEGPVIETGEDVVAGSFLRIETKDRIVVCTLTKVKHDFRDTYCSASFRVTEHRKEI